MGRNFGGGNGEYVWRSTDNGTTWGPSGGLNIVTGFPGGLYHGSSEPCGLCFLVRGQLDSGSQVDRQG